MTKTTSALERLREVHDDLDFIAHSETMLSAMESRRDAQRILENAKTAIAAFEDEQRQRDERDAKIRELLLHPRNTPDDYHSDEGCIPPCSFCQALALLDGGEHD